MFTVEQILDLATEPPTSEWNGRLMYSAMQSDAGSEGVDRLGREFLEDLRAEPLPVQPPLHQHPDRQRAGANALRPAGPLAAAEIAWLGTLPADPAVLPFTDAVALAQLAKAVPAMNYAADARLIEVHWAPVRELHDRMEAEAELVAAQAPVPTPPPSTVAARTAAINRRYPDLTPAEAGIRAREALDDRLARLRFDREDRIAKARARIAQLAAAAAERTSPTKPTPAA